MSAENSKPGTGTSAADLVRRADEARERGDLPETERLLRRAAELQQPDEVGDQCAVLDQLGHVLRDQGRLDEAHELYETAETARREHYGAEHPVSAISFDNRATVLLQQNKLEAAEELLRRSLVMRRSALPDDHPLVADSLFFLARLEMAKGRWLEAEQKLTGAVSVRRASLGAGHRGYWEALAALFDFYGERGRTTALELAFEEAVADGEAVLGEESLGVGRITAAGSRALLSAGNSTAAADASARALRIFTAKEGYEDERSQLLYRLVDLETSAGRIARATDYLESLLDTKRGADEEVVLLERLLGLLLEQERSADAEPVLGRLLELRRTLLGDELGTVAATWEQLAGLRNVLGRHDEAVVPLETALKIHRSRDEREKARAVMGQLVGLDLHLGRFEEAESRLRELQGEHRPEELEEILDILLQRVRIQKHLGDGEAAEASIDEALELGEGADHPKTADFLELRARYHRDRSELPAAERFLRRGFELRRRTLGEDHPKTAASESQIADLYADEGRFEEAVELYERALGRLSDDADPQVRARILLGAAEACFDAERPDAEARFRRAREASVRGFGEASLETVEAESALGRALRAAGKGREAAQAFDRALATARELLADDHPHLAGLELLRAQNLWQMGHFEEAEAPARRALHIRRRNEQPNRAALHNLLALILAGQGRHREADEEYAEALELHERVYGPEHPDRLEILTNRAVSRRLEDRPREAVELFEQVLAARERGFGPAHPKVAETLGLQAEALEAAGRVDDGVESLRRALEILEQHPDHRWLPVLRDRLSLLEVSP